MRYTCGIFVGVVMTVLLAAAAMAWMSSPSAWTWAAVGVMTIFNIVIWSGFGRALYDVFLPDIFPREDRLDEE